MTSIDFRLFFQAVPGLHIVLSPELKIVATSDAYLIAANKQREEIVGLPFLEVFDVSTEELLLTALNTVLEEKRTYYTPLRKYDFRKPDGTVTSKYWSSEDKPLLNSNNEIEYILHSVQDITELVRSEQLFSTIFEHNPASIGLSRVSDGKIINVNKTFLSIFGYSKKEEVIGKTSADLALSMDVKGRDKLIAAIKNGEVASDIEAQLLKRDGKMHFFSTSVQVVEINGESCLLATMQDVTQKKEQNDLLIKQAEQLKQANEELETFSYSVSHDLKAPLRSLEGFSKLLMEEYGGKFSEEADRWLGFIASNANRMGLLINDILNFSRISRSSVNKSTVNMNALVQKAFDSEQLNYPGKTIDLKVSELGTVYGDPVMLGQVWQNLISNALKYSSKNETIFVEIDRKTENESAVFSIKDHGAGFDEKYKEKLFGVFQRLHRPEEFEGTGVGLAIVNRILQKHEGSITASSILGKETVFTFTIPLTKPSEA